MWFKRGCAKGMLTSTYRSTSTPYVQTIWFGRMERMNESRSMKNYIPRANMKGNTEVG